jgi:hypothetical protein
MNKPNVWIAGFALGTFSGLVAGSIAFLISFPDFLIAGLVAFGIVFTGILGFTYLDEMYSYVAWNRANRASARKERAKQIALRDYWVDWEGTSSIVEEPGLEDDALVVQNRTILANGKPLQAQETIPAKEWDRRQKAIEFMRWAWALNGVTSTLMVPRAVNSGEDWVTITTILAQAGLVAKTNGKPTQLMVNPDEAIERIRSGKVMLEGKLPA